jgi:hypothetical protein
MYGCFMTVATFTDFLRTPKAVVAATEKGAVHITRRGAEDLVLVKASDVTQQQEGVALASRLIRAKLAHSGSMADAVRALFAWTELLDAEELETFASEMERLVWSAAELGRYNSLLLAFASWESTASAYAEGLLEETSDRLTWLTQQTPVPRP